MKSHFRNWFKSYGKSHSRELSETFAASIHGRKVVKNDSHTYKLEISFQDTSGDKILFTLNESDSENFIRQTLEIICPTI